MTPLKKTLPAHYYTDHAWFDAEMDRIFARMWINAGRIDPMVQRGTFVRRDVAKASVLIVADGEGAAPGRHHRHRYPVR